MHRCIICLVRIAVHTEVFTTLIVKPFLYFWTKREERRDSIRMCNSQCCQAIGQSLATFNHMLEEDQQMNVGNRDNIEKAMNHLKGLQDASIKEQQKEAWTQGVEAETEHSIFSSSNGREAEA